MNKLKKKILITGGKGFIARHLFEGLNDQYSIQAPNSRELNLLDDKKVADFLKQNKFDVVIHAATYDAAPKDSPKDPSKVLDNNLKMFNNLAQLNDHFGKMLYFGSGAEFSRPHWQAQMPESYFGQHLPTDQYGLSKYKMTLEAQASRNIYNLRLFAVFGEYEDWRYRFISNICAKAVLDIPITIKHNKVFDFLYVADLVRIVRWFIENQSQQHVYNVCSGEAYEFRALAEKIIKISGRPLGITVKDTDAGIEYSGDNSLLLSELGGFEFTPIDQALKTLYEWHEANKGVLKRDEFHY